MRQLVEKILGSALPSELVKYLLDSYFEQKQNFYLGKFRPSELDAGRFTEAVIRNIEQLTSGQNTPLNKSLPSFDKILARFEKLPTANFHESLRLHIPRALWSVYNIRNRRDVGHIGGDVNPNIADAYFVMSVCDWVLTEIIRILYNCPLEEAQALVDGLVERKIPLIQDFNGYLKILNTKLSTTEQILSILYYMGEKGVKIENLYNCLKHLKKSTISSTLSRLEHKYALIHRSNNMCWITNSGIRYVEEKINFSI